jgi:hypothetical protein
MKRNQWLGLLGLLLILILLNGCGSSDVPEAVDSPAATSPPSSIGSQGSHLLRPTPANPEQKVEPTRAITADTIAQQPVLVTSNTASAANIHRNSHLLYLMIVIRRPD